MELNNNKAERDFIRVGQPYPAPGLVMLTQLGLFILGSGIGAILYGVIAHLAGWDITLSLLPDSPEADRWQIRIQLGLGHLTGFCASGLFTAWLFYRPGTGSYTSWPDYLQINRMPDWSIVVLALLLMIISTPFVLFTLQLNQQIPLPESFKVAEEQAELVLKGLLNMEYPAELIGNLILIAVLPAIGEEIVFRGIVQRQLMRVMLNPYVALFVAAVIFSLAHFQMEGFIPRLVLGMVLGWLYWKSGNLWVPSIAHLFNNGAQVLGQYLHKQGLSSVNLEDDISVPVVAALLSLLLAAGVITLINKRTDNKGYQS
ncbi:MAG: lysostaphin resistance A-like protein [Bacteroidota bacterium]|jgi:membrane protease YdiL (CAAX protease family)